LRARLAREPRTISLRIRRRITIKFLACFSDGAHDVIGMRAAVVIAALVSMCAVCLAFVPARALERDQ